MISSRRKREKITEGEINITAFLNLMVVLIPFLLITAVFSQMAVLDLFLPPGSNNSNPDDDKPSLVLELIIRDKAIEIGDRNQGLLKIIPKVKEQYDFQEAHDFLITLKNKFPEILEVSILLEKDIEYEVLINAMDTVRLMDTLINGQSIKTELFPNISIGSAPLPFTSNNPDTSSSSEAAL